MKGLFSKSRFEFIIKIICFDGAGGGGGGDGAEDAFLLLLLLLVGGDAGVGPTDCGGGGRKGRHDDG